MNETEQGQSAPPSQVNLAAQKRRNLWLGLALAAFVVTVLAVTIVRISQGGAAMPDGGF